MVGRVGQDLAFEDGHTGRRRWVIRPLQVHAGSLAKTGLLLVTCCIAGCARSPLENATSQLNEEVRFVELSVTPVQALVQRRSSMVMDARGVRQEWLVTSSEGWLKYSASVRRALELRYACAPASPSTLRCFRDLPGDQFQVDLLSQAEADGVTISVRFEGRPQ
jgi:hypothetical protein